MIGKSPHESRHAHLPRGLWAAGEARKGLKSPFGARFGRMFPNLPAATFGASTAEEDKNLGTLADKMIAGFDPPKDGPDDEESGIPSLYTYFGQFVDHDLTFDPAASFMKQRDPSATVDFRTPAFDLDNVYGRGPGDQPYMYASDGKTFLLGEPITSSDLGSFDPRARDLQRNAEGRALIGDPRNDENAIVSQLQGLFLRFHNRAVRDNPALSFDKVQEFVRDHYQFMVINDFLPRIVHASVLRKLKSSGVYDQGKLEFFTKFDNPFMPIEFSTAAYRLGHSMIRPGYRLNDSVLLPIFPIPPEIAQGFGTGLTGFRRLVSNWALDWDRFIDLDERNYGTQTPAKQPPKKAAADAEDNFRRLQFAYRIDTSLVDPLRNLPASVVGNKPKSLAARNLERGRDFGLPNGQTIADFMHVQPLKDSQILIGQGIDHPKPRLLDIVQATGVRRFSNNCPLWTYILAEAMHNQESPPRRAPVNGRHRINTPQLGPVGGRIVAETFLGLMFADPKSYLSRDPAWTPKRHPDFGLKDFVRIALADA